MFEFKNSPKGTSLPKRPSSFLLNRDDNSTPSFLSSLKVLLRHRKYIIPHSWKRL